MRMNRAICITVLVSGAACLALPFTAAAAAPPQAPPAAAQLVGTTLYRTTQSLVLGSPDRWDYLSWDPVSHRIFAAHQSTVTVVDADRLSVVGQVPPPLVPATAHIVSSF